MGAGHRPKGKRTHTSGSTDWLGQPMSSVPGSGGRRSGASRKRPNALAASAEDDSGLRIFPLASSLPFALLYCCFRRSAGRWGKNGEGWSMAGD